MNIKQVKNKEKSTLRCSLNRNEINRHIYFYFLLFLSDKKRIEKRESYQDSHNHKNRRSKTPTVSRERRKEKEKKTRNRH